MLFWKKLCWVWVKTWKHTHLQGECSYEPGCQIISMFSKGERCLEKAVRTLRAAILEIAKEMAILLLRTRNGFSHLVSEPQYSQLWFPLHLNPPAPSSPQPHSRSQFKSCILIPLNIHLCLSFQSFSVKLHFFVKEPEVVQLKLIF